MTSPTPRFGERFDPESGLVGELTEADAGARDRRRQGWAVAWPDRCLAVNRARGTMHFHSLSGMRQRGYLAYRLARKTRQWRLEYLYVAGSSETYLMVEVPLWEGRARVVVAPFEVPSEIEPPAESLRAVGPPDFGDWDAVLAMPTDPRRWISIPAGFDLAAG